MSIAKTIEADLRYVEDRLDWLNGSPGYEIEDIQRVADAVKSLALVVRHLAEEIDQSHAD